MKTLKLSVLVLFSSLVFTQVSHGATVAEVDQGAGQKVDEIAGNVGAGIFDFAHNKAGQKAEQALKQLEGTVGNAGSSVSGLSTAVQALGQAANSCKKYTETGLDCCNNPQNCGGSADSAASQADKAAQETAQQAQQAVGGGEAGGGEGGGNKAAAAAQCLSSLPGLMAMKGKSQGTGMACGLIRDGDGGRMGCSTACGNVEQAARKIISAANSLLAGPQGATVNNLRQEAQKYAQIAGDSGGQCSSGSAGGEQAANAQADSGQGAMGGLMECLKSLMAGDETPEEEEEEEQEEPKVAVNCSDPAQRSASPEDCIGYGGGGAEDGLLSKTSGSNLGIEEGSPASDLTDSLGDPESIVQGTPPGPPVGASSLKTTTPVSAGLSGSGGVNGKTGRKRRGGDKGKSLVSGYKKSRASGSGGGRSRRPSSKRFKPFSFGKKKKSKNNKKALAALMKAGVSPDQSGSIFVRSSKRFISSSAKEKLFDAKRNRKTWMERRK